ncbi:MAG: ferritin-like domain-containing protein [Acidobacteria bacterium]|nr:ferritin-like domain-containing protein [Acidobacteriota bacterium]
MSEKAFRALVRTLQNAASGELAAGYAYRGHWKSVRNVEERTRIRQIEDEEWHHRELVIGLLRTLGSKPRPLREAVFWTIGRILGAACQVSGWFFPMYGAGRLERRNIVEYEDAAHHALACGHPEMLDCMLEMAEVEWEHERYFRERVIGHPWTKVFRLWSEAPPKESIRAAFERAA